MKRPPRRLLLVTLLFSVITSPASAADELALSRDGTTWAPSIDVPLFDQSVRWVPGDSRSTAFHVRNQGRTPADLTVAVTSSRAGELMDSGDLRITARGGGGTWTSVNESGTRRLLSTPDIVDGVVVPITVTVAFDADSTNLTQLRSTSFRLQVNLVESAGNTDGDVGNGGEERDDAVSGLLPDTGAPSTWIAGIGALLVGIGLALTARRRPNHETDAHA